MELYKVNDRVRYFNPFDGDKVCVGTILEIDNKRVDTTVVRYVIKRDDTKEVNAIPEISIIGYYVDYSLDDSTLRDIIVQKIWVERQYYINKYRTKPKYIKFPQTLTVAFNPVIFRPISGHPTDMLLGLQVCATDSISTIEEIEVF